MRPFSVLTPKLVALYLCKWLDAAMLERCAMAGAFFETHVVCEVIKSFNNADVDPKRFLYYYRDKDNKEVDILYLKDVAICPIEIKKGINPPKPTKNFRVLGKHKMPILPGMVVDCADAIKPINEDAFVCPVTLVRA